MTYRHILALVVAASTSCIASAQVTLNLNNDIDLLVVNEAQPKISGGLFSKNKTVTLDDGEHQVVFRYQKSFRQGNETLLYKSDPIIATFEASETSLSFQTPFVKDIKQAQSIESEMKWQLVDEQGTTVGLKQDTLNKSGVQIGRDYIEEVANYNQTDGIAKWPQQSQPTVLVIPSLDNSDNTAEEMLYFWYQKADPQTRERFREAINSQALEEN